MAKASNPGEVPSVTASKREMKPKDGKKVLSEVRIRKEAKGFTVTETYEAPDAPMSYQPPQRYAFSTEAEATQYVTACMKRLGRECEDVILDRVGQGGIIAVGDYS